MPDSDPKVPVDFFTIQSEAEWLATYLPQLQALFNEMQAATAKLEQTQSNDPKLLAALGGLKAELKKMAAVLENYEQMKKKKMQ